MCRYPNPFISQPPPSPLENQLRHGLPGTVYHYPVRTFYVCRVYLSWALKVLSVEKWIWLKVVFFKGLRRHHVVIESPSKFKQGLDPNPPPPPWKSFLGPDRNGFARIKIIMFRAIWTTDTRPLNVNKGISQARRIFLKTSAPRQSRKASRLISLSARSLSLDSTFKGVGFGCFRPESCTIVRICTIPCVQTQIRRGIH